MMVKWVKVCIPLFNYDSKCDNYLGTRLNAEIMIPKVIVEVGTVLDVERRVC